MTRPSQSENFPYFMEHPDESVRLQIKTDQSSTQKQLIQTGLAELKGQPHIVDAGSGSGAVAKEMAEIAVQQYAQSSITLLDGSKERLEAAKQHLGDYENIALQFRGCRLEQIPLDNNSVDFLFCRFVFEYLEDQEVVFNEFCRIVRPGGKLVVGDLDYNGMTHYPLGPVLEEQISELSKVIQESGSLDVYAGRRIYSYFQRAGLTDIDIHLSAHHLFWGDLSSPNEINWTAKLDQLIQYQDKGAIKLSFDLREFKTNFMEFLRSPERFSYTPLILVEGLIPT